MAEQRAATWPRLPFISSNRSSPFPTLSLLLLFTLFFSFVAAVTTTTTNNNNNNNNNNVNRKVSTESSPPSGRLGAVVFASSDISSNPFLALAAAGVAQFSSLLSSSSSSLSSSTYTDFIWSTQLLDISNDTSTLSHLSHYTSLGYTLFLFPGFEFTSLVVSFSPLYPNNKFVLIDQLVEGVSMYPNLLSVVFAEDQMSFLAGIETGKILESMNHNINNNNNNNNNNEYIPVINNNDRTAICFGGVPIAPVRRLCNGFQLGVQRSCPTCRIYSIYFNSFTDEPSFSLLAPLLYSPLGIRIGFGAGGAAGLNAIAGMAGTTPNDNSAVYVIGVDTDAYLHDLYNRSYSSRILTSAMKRVDVVTYQTCLDVFLNKWVGGIVKTYTLETNGVSLAPCHDACGAVTNDTVKLINSYSNLLADGALTTGVDPNTGFVLVSGDSTLRPSVTKSASGTPSPRSSSSLVYSSMLPALIVYGGTSIEQGGIQNDVYLYDLGSLSFLPRFEGFLMAAYNSSDDLPSYLQQHTAVILADPNNYFNPGAVAYSMVVFGGINERGHVLNDLLIADTHAFDFSPSDSLPEDRWRRLRPTTSSNSNSNSWPAPRSDHAAVVVEGATNNFYVFGGRIDGTDVTNELWKCTLGTVAHLYSDTVWTQLTYNSNSNSNNIQPPVKARHSLVEIDGVLLAFGGVGDNINIPQNTLYGYNLTSNQWVALASSPYGPRSWHTAVVVQNITSPTATPTENLMLVIGGVSTLTASGQVIESDILVYSLHSNSWHKVTMNNGSCILGRARHSAVAVGNRVYVYGGFGANGEQLFTDICYFDYVFIPPPIARFGVIDNSGPPSFAGGSVQFVNEYKDQNSGSPLYPPLLLSFYDSSNHPASVSDSSYIIRAHSSAGIQIGQTDVPVINGVANFTSYGLLILPGSSADVTFTLTLADNSILTYTITVHIAPCSNAYFLDSTALVCRPCQQSGGASPSGGNNNNGGGQVGGGGGVNGAAANIGEMTTITTNAAACVSVVRALLPIGLPYTPAGNASTYYLSNPNQIPPQQKASTLYASSLCIIAQVSELQSGAPFPFTLRIQASSFNITDSTYHRLFIGPPPLSTRLGVRLSSPEGTIILPDGASNSFPFVNGVASLAGVGLSYYPGASATLIVELNNVPEADAAVLVIKVDFANTPLYTMKEGYKVGILITSSLLIAVDVVFIILVLFYYSDRIIFTVSPIFCIIILLGILMVLISSILNVVDLTVASCIVQLSLFHIGFTLVFGSIFAKSYRFYRFSKNPMLRILLIQDKDLFQLLGLLVVIDTVILILWQSLSPYTIRIDQYTECYSSQGQPPRIVFIVLKSFLLLVSAYFSYVSRLMPSAFSEARRLSITIYNIIIIGLVVILLTYIVSGNLTVASAAVVNSISMIVGAASTLLVLFVPMFYLVLSQQAEDGFAEANKVVARSNSIQLASPISPTYQPGPQTGGGPPLHRTPSTSGRGHERGGGGSGEGAATGGRHDHKKTGSAEMAIPMSPLIGGTTSGPRRRSSILQKNEESKLDDGASSTMDIYASAAKATIVHVDFQLLNLFQQQIASKGDKDELDVQTLQLISTIKNSERRRIMAEKEKAEAMRKLGNIIIEMQYLSQYPHRRSISNNGVNNNNNNQTVMPPDSSTAATGGPALSPLPAPLDSHRHSAPNSPLGAGAPRAILKQNMAALVHRPSTAGGAAVHAATDGPQHSSSSHRVPSSPILSANHAARTVPTLPRSIGVNINEGKENNDIYNAVPPSPGSRSRHNQLPSYSPRAAHASSLSAVTVHLFNIANNTNNNNNSTTAESPRQHTVVAPSIAEEQPIQLEEGGGETDTADMSSPSSLRRLNTDSPIAAPATTAPAAPTSSAPPLLLFAFSSLKFTCTFVIDRPN